MLFKYTVVDREGKESEGQAEASSESQVIDRLMNNGFTVLSIEAVKESQQIRLSFLRRVKTQEKVIFFNQTAMLFGANVPTSRVFNLIAENLDNKYFQEVIQDIAQTIEQGNTVERAFSRHPDVFSEFFISIIRVGEESAKMNQSFAYLADYTERNAEIYSKLKKALTYPIFIVITFVGVVILMLVTVIPQVSSILIQSGTELPLITKVVIGLSDFFKNNIVLILLGMVGGLFGLIYWARSDDGRETVDRTVLQLPVIGLMWRTFYMVLLTQNLAIMLKSSIPQAQALQIASRVMDNLEYKRLVENAAKSVQSGIPLSVALKSQELISKHVIQVVKVGEETGKTDEMLSVISRLYKSEFDNKVDRAIDFIQPTVIILLGITVGGLIGSVIVPIYSITSGI